MNRWSGRIAAGFFLLVAGSIVAADPEPITVETVSVYYDPNRPEATPHLIQLMRERPDIQIEMWSGLRLPGGGGRAPLMMAIAGKTSPDIMQSWFHIIRNDIDQGFLYPLNEWIGEDRDGDGQIGTGEAVWDGWSDVPELWRRVATLDGKVYGIPEVNRAMMGVLFRTDLVRNAGLDPERPPKTWDEFYYWCMRLSDPGVELPGRSFAEGQRAIALMPFGFTWLPWVQSAGGQPVVEIRRDPATGIEHVFSPDDSEFATGDGVDLSGEPSTFRAAFDSPEGLAAAAFYHKMRWAPWIVDAASGVPISLSTEDLAAGRVEVDGRIVEFTPEAVNYGVARVQAGPRDVSPLEMLGRGEVAMTTWFVTDLLTLGSNVGINPDLLSWFPFPARDAESPRVVQTQAHYAAMCINVQDRTPEERNAIWTVLSAITDRTARDENIRRMVVSGLARFVNPADLERLGFDDYLRDVPPAIRENYQQLDDGTIKVFTEPYEGYWLTMDGALNREVLSLILAQTGANFDYEAALRKVTHDANSGVMFGRSQAELDRYRLPARIIFGVIVAAIVVFVGMIIRSIFVRRERTVRSGMVSKPWLPAVMLFPALFLIGLWGYYPLGRGMVMAFQDFRIAGDSLFVGLDNFISLALDQGFWMSMWRTLYYVALTMLLSFTTPIILAVMLSEVPRGKIFFRTLFFLPQITSGLVIALMWKMMYDPNPTGIFNQMITAFNWIPGINIEPQSWLLDPHLAMWCVVLPTAWATAGIQSLIYLAALKSVPEETYEACEIEGGGIFAKIRHITLPILMPLIIINFVGAFIGTFQNMGNIFLLTFGGPGEATMVVGMRIWIEAYNNLRFSMATSMAWVMGAALIGFTFIQLQFLKKIEFRRASA